MKYKWLGQIGNALAPLTTAVCPNCGDRHDVRHTGSLGVVSCNSEIFIVTYNGMILVLVPK